MLGGVDFVRHAMGGRRESMAQFPSIFFLKKYF